MTYIPSGKEEAVFLAKYDSSAYEKPSVAADIAIFAVDNWQLKILLIRRGGFPYKGCWALPGGFVDIDEDIIVAAKRELKEETGIEAPYVEQAAVWGRPGRDPRQRVITVSYIGVVDPLLAHEAAGDDAAEARWFIISQYKKSVGETETLISYTLVGNMEIEAQVMYPNDRLQEMSLISGGLAFDHAESIAVSVEILKSRSDIIVPLSLQKEKAHCALEIINNL